MLGQYTLHNKLGQGGYSSVYKCTDSIGIRYACKVMPKDANKRYRVQREIEVMKALQALPKVVRFVEAGEDTHSFYIVQELCRGGQVKDYVASHLLRCTYAENTVASVVRGVLRGLVHMHERGIVHCDIKAGNILLGDTSEDADVKIADFGTAIFTNGGLTEVEELVGTPWFMAPENLRHDYHTSSDVWSLGVMTFQLLTGRMPFNDTANPHNPSINRIWRSILLEEPRWGSTCDVSPEARDFVRLCLAKQFGDRPTARDALGHKWLTSTDCNDRFKGQPLNCKPFQYEMDAQTIRLKHV
jgi:calcium-dependent protein kinase